MTAPLPPLDLHRAGQRVPVAWYHSTVLPDIDFETFSAAGFEWDEATRKFNAPPGATKKGLPAIGAAVYAEHPSTEVLCLAYDLKRGEGRKRWRQGDPLPLDLLQHLATFDPSAPPSYEQAGLIEAHNAMFEVRLYLRVLHERCGWPRLDMRQFRCSMAKARAFALPAALGNLADVLGSTPKNKAGDALIKLFSMPRNPTAKKPETRVLSTDEPAKFGEFEQYNEDDIIAEADVSRRLPDLLPFELDYWLADQACNWRGVGVDVAAVNDCIAVLEQAHSKYNAELYAITGGQVARASEASKLQAWVYDQCGLRMSSMDSDAVDDALGRDGLPPAVHRALTIRSLIGSASVKKVYAMARVATEDARLCDLFNYHGARTGRDTHADVQPGNLPKNGPALRWCESDGCGRPYAKALSGCPWCGASDAFSRADEWGAEAVDSVLEIMAYRNLELVEYFFGDAVLAIAGCVRGLLVAAPGHDLICSDYSSIEAVGLAMLAGEQWRIEAFRKGESIYYHGAAGVTGRSYEWYMQYEAEHGRHPDRNKIGKVAELACLSPETQVLTDRGYSAIVDIRPTDKLWDGVEWVTHGGLLGRGRKKVISLDGVRITPDHLVNLNGSWKAAEKLGSNKQLLRQALATASGSLPYSAKFHGKRPALECSSSSVRAGLIRTKPPSIMCLKAAVPGATPAPKRQLRLIEKCITALRQICLTANIGGGSSTGYLPQLVGATTRNGSSTPTTAGGVFSSAMSGAQTGALFFDTFRRARGGITQNWTWIVATMTKVMSRGTCGLSAAPPITSTSGRSPTCKPGSENLSLVYDIANAGPRNRFTVRTDSGHLIVHNCGYMGWVNAWRNFDSTDTFTDDEVKAKINKWRAASPALVELAGGQVRGKPWQPDRMENYGYEGMFLNAILYPGRAFEYRGISFEMIGDALFVTLLSGRRLTYHSPRAVPTQRFEGVTTYELSYMTWNSNPSMGALGWTRMNTYAGRLVENITQAVCRDIMSAAVVRLEKAGYPVVMRVHDEIVSEVPHGYGSAEDFERIMAELPDWAADWPVKCGGTWRGRRYRKD